MARFTDITVDITTPMLQMQKLSVRVVIFAQDHTNVLLRWSWGLNLSLYNFRACFPPQAHFAATQKLNLQSKNLHSILSLIRYACEKFLHKFSLYG